MKYYLSFPNPQDHFIHLSIPLAANPAPTRLHLPTWRPGRYERSIYCENICDVTATTLSGKSLKVTKTETHHWTVEPSEEAFHFQYKYFAKAHDAGASFIDREKVYFNGVNLFMYQPGQLQEPCEVHLDLPDNYRIACGLRREGKVLFAEDFHQLVDGPCMASPLLQHDSVEVEGVSHHLWFLGNTRPDWSLLKNHFQAFGEAQVRLFGGFPVDEYHYLFLIHDFHHYHGVEHYNSTVIVLGPGYKLMAPELYEELLGVSSHELFHTWNVKAIRPADMQPYDYEGPNYSRLHYITEGVTTYYGDLMLLKGGVWNLDTYLRVFNNSVLKRHYAHNGRDHISLEQSSFDSWLVGYKGGVPNRKISFYTKGALAAFILDHHIRQASQNRHSLDTVMREMYDRFGKTATGYTKADYRSISESFSGTDLGWYFEEIIAGIGPLEARLQEAANYFGLALIERKFNHPFERQLGFTTLKSDLGAKVRQVYENSPAALAGLEPDDILIAVNGIQVSHPDLRYQIELSGPDQPVELAFFRMGRLQTISLQADPQLAQPLYMLARNPNATPEQIKNQQAWLKVQTP